MCFSSLFLFYWYYDDISFQNPYGLIFTLLFLPKIYYCIEEDFRYNVLNFCYLILFFEFIHNLLIIRSNEINPQDLIFYLANTSYFCYRLYRYNKGNVLNEIFGIISTKLSIFYFMNFMKECLVWYYNCERITHYQLDGDCLNENKIMSLGIIPTVLIYIFLMYKNINNGIFNLIFSIFCCYMEKDIMNVFLMGLLLNLIDIILDYENDYSTISEECSVLFSMKYFYLKICTILISVISYNCHLKYDLGYFRIFDLFLIFTGIFPTMINENPVEYHIIKINSRSHKLIKKFYSRILHLIGVTVYIGMQIYIVLSRSNYTTTFSYMIIAVIFILISKLLIGQHNFGNFNKEEKYKTIYYEFLLLLLSFYVGILQNMKGLPFSFFGELNHFQNHDVAYLFGMIILLVYFGMYGNSKKELYQYLIIAITVSINLKDIKTMTKIKNSITN